MPFISRTDISAFITSVPTISFFRYGSFLPWIHWLDASFSSPKIIGPACLANTTLPFCATHTPHLPLAETIAASKNPPPATAHQDVEVARKRLEKEGNFVGWLNGSAELGDIASFREDCCPSRSSESRIEIVPRR